MLQINGNFGEIDSIEVMKVNSQGGIGGEHDKAFQATRLLAELEPLMHQDE
ncbi:hypothetical protein [Halobacillus sp. Cin3]|uniref:hypothetical protein n=1 Tax=Halobacillus sp. Cin3 TaxID=2928441 RepID=UPI00248DE85F|nr:hypothetical protein [Halobacillus sp. Cin3]